MNKDVIYIEPEDDITDIIVKIENSKEKIVALVPPKKAGVFRSVVNIKLMAKSATSSGKTVVLVTTDPSIVKLAGASKLPVTKDLQSAPTIPEAEEENNTSKEDLVEKDEEDSEDETPEKEEDDKEKPSEEEDNKEDSTEKDEDDEDEDEEADEDGEEDEDEDEMPIKKKGKAKAKKVAKKAVTSGNKFIRWFKLHKILAISLSCGGILLILLLVWALVIAPAVTITVGIKTDSNNFSENVTFTTKLEEESADEGKFYLDEKKTESTQEIEFEATGKKNVGEKAKGEVKVYAYFPLNIKSSVQISEGETFTISGLTYKATETETLTYSGEGKNECGNKDNPQGMVDYGCRINGSIAVVATEPGSKYNIAASSTGWDTNARVFAYSDKAMSGGTDQEITVVQQSDIDKAKAELTATDEAKNKEKLLESIDGEVILINSSFNQSASEVTSTPAVNEEVKEGVKPTLKATTKASIYVIDKTKVEEFITKKANLGEAQKIYQMNEPFIENFSNNNNGITGKLKASYLTGPKITENDVVEKTRGKGLGEAQHDLRDIDGISAVTIDKSFPWVMSVPGDANKITVIFEVRDQSGNEVKTKEETKEDKKEESKEEESSKEDKKD
ncbi:hypothetical protein IKD98_02465 [Candidatus Saccharibacteria bacterium]|nr:hypothetical protein [Candidatus Saccharibacteria bacterium]